jgi:hypothetical protein
MDEAERLVLTETLGSQAGSTPDEPIVAVRGIEVHSQEGTTASSSGFPL